jgi:hypothetical protein
MNRLTRRNGAGSAIPNNGFGGLTNSAGQQIINALAAYEDTGLTPEEIKALQELHDFYNSKDCLASRRLVELALADKDGRLVVLPCKIGTKVYFISQDCEMCRSLQKDEPCLFGDCPYRGITETIFTYGAIGQFGKTAFLTREEAEAALRKEQGDETHN